MLVAAAAFLSTVAIAGCSPHTVSQQNPCSEASIRGAIALAKVGLTPKELKLQQKC
jgi:hypothetical protein